MNVVVARYDSEEEIEAEAAVRKIVVSAEEAHQNAHIAAAEVVVVVDVVRLAAAPDSPVHKNWGLPSVWHI